MFCMSAEMYFQHADLCINECNHNFRLKLISNQEDTIFHLNAVYSLLTHNHDVGVG